MSGGDDGSTALAHEIGAAEPPLLEETIGENLARAVAAHPDREALVVVDQGIRLTYAELAERVDELARALLASGFTTGDRIGIWAPNCAEWVLVQYATARLGIVLVNINPAYRTHEVRYALDQSGCRGLIAAENFKTSDYRSMVAEVRGDLPALEQVYYVDTDGSEGSEGSGRSGRSDGWGELLARASEATSEEVAAIEARLDRNDPINIQYTSGTTGYPKGATLSHHNILNNAFFVGEGCGYTPDDRVCVPVPFYHCFGMVMGNLGCTTHGSTIVVPAAAFDPEATLSTLTDERCTSLYGVPTMFIAMLGHPHFDRFDLGALRTGIMAGSPCPIEIMKQCIERMNMDQVTICYGMTETSPVSTQTALDDPIDKRVATVGRVHPHVEIKIVDPETGETVGRGSSGELCTRGYSVMIGYWNDQERTTEAIDDDGWMHTGDLATMDDDGYVNIVGRIKDMIIRGGENVYPREIEEFLYTHPAIKDVQVVGVPDARYGEEIMAWILLEDGGDLGGPAEDAVREFCRGKIAHYKIPRYVAVADELPMTVTGKVQKFKLREEAIGLLGLVGEAGIETA